MVDNAQGASSSLRKSIGILSTFLRTSSPRCRVYETGLRGQLDALVWEVGRRGFEAGFRAAHEECARLAEQKGEFPITVTFEAVPKLAPNAEGAIRLKSTVQKTKILKLPKFVLEVSFWDRFDFRRKQ